MQTLRAFSILHIQRRAFLPPETQRFSSWDLQHHARLQSLREVLTLGEARNSLAVAQNHRALSYDYIHRPHEPPPFQQYVNFIQGESVSVFNCFKYPVLSQPN